MGKEVYRDSLTDLAVRINMGLNNRTTPLNELSVAFTQLRNSGAIQGQTADAMRAYIDEVHSSLIMAIQVALNNYQMAIGEYIQGYLGVDADENFRLVDEELSAHSDQLSGGRSDYRDIARRLQSLSNSAVNLVSLNGAGSAHMGRVADTMNEMLRTVSDLKKDWDAYEQHDPGFEAVEDLITQARQLIRNTLTVPRGYAYSPGSFSQLMTEKFIIAMRANVDYATDEHRQSQYAQNWDAIAKEYVEDEERAAEEARRRAEEAEKKANRKAGLWGMFKDRLQIAGGAVITVVGLGLTPLTDGVSLSLVGLGSSMVVGGVNSLIDDTSKVITGKGYNLIGKAAEGIGTWYDQNVDKRLGNRGWGGAANGFMKASGTLIEQWATLNVEDAATATWSLAKQGYSLATHPGEWGPALKKVGDGLSNMWRQVTGGNTEVIGQSAGYVVTFLLGSKTAGVKLPKPANLVKKVKTKFSKKGASVLTKGSGKGAGILAKTKTTMKGYKTATINKVTSVLSGVKGKIEEVSNEFQEKFFRSRQLAPAGGVDDSFLKKKKFETSSPAEQNEVQKNYWKSMEEQGGGKGRYNHPEVSNMKEFFQLDFGKELKPYLKKTKKRVQGQSVYEFKKSGTEIREKYGLKKGDQLYLDAQHKNHLEVFTSENKIKKVMHLDGTLNEEKTRKAIAEGRILPGD